MERALGRLEPASNGARRSRRTLRERLRSREPVYGAWTSLAHPSIPEIFTRTGVDFIGIDLEHSTINQAEAQRMIAASQAGGAACLPRLTSDDTDQIERLLDSGADGLIAPNVSTMAHLEHVVAACKYPPAGKRSYGIARGQGYGFEFGPYTTRWNEQGILIIQIESVQGIEAVETLLAHEGVDGVMIGPYDLSGSLGIPGELSHPRVAEACRRVLDVCQKRGKACGTQLIEPTGESVRDAFGLGYTFVVLASDVFILWKWSERMQTLIQATVQMPVGGEATT